MDTAYVRENPLTKIAESKIQYHTLQVPETFSDHMFEAVSLFEGSGAIDLKM